jgi:hypothetical protein
MYHHRHRTNQRNGTSYGTSEQIRLPFGILHTPQMFVHLLFQPLAFGKEPPLA